jgi:hypothetical protein
MSDESIAESRRGGLSYKVTYVWCWYCLFKALGSAYPEQVKMDDFWKPYEEYPDFEIIRQCVLLLESFSRSLIDSQSEHQD